MTIANKKEPLILLVVDVLLFLTALWITLFVRYVEIPSRELIYSHIVPFSFLFVVWVIVYFVSGLYGKHTTLLRNKLPSIILNAQGINIILAAFFFFFVPYFGIAPKTNLVLYLVISSLLILVWRMQVFPKIGFSKKQKTVIVGRKDEIEELVQEVNNNPRYNIKFILAIEVDKFSSPKELQNEIADTVNTSKATIIVADTKSNEMKGILSTLYPLTFSGIKTEFLDIHTMYENIFDRIPLSVLNEGWILENISTSPKIFYDTVKRTVDIFSAILLGIFSLLLYPFVYIAIKLQDGGQVFFTQDRIGKDNKAISIIKFRTMSGVDTGDQVLKSTNEVTRVGKVLRATRIDELPQIWNVLKGDLSLIGPRPEINKLVHHYAENIQYYNIRHSIKPGLTGWAQIRHEGHPHHGAEVFETERKLSYDLYYLKERSLILDLHIALQTIKTILSRGGR